MADEVQFNRKNSPLLIYKIFNCALSAEINFFYILNQIVQLPPNVISSQCKTTCSLV